MIKDIKLRWVCYAPGVVLIGDTDTELRKFIRNNFTPYVYENAMYQFPAREDDYRNYYNNNNEFILKQRKFKLRFLLGIGSNISTYKCDAIKYLEKLF